MKNTLEIFADFSCPWSYFILPNIEKLESEHDVKVKWKAFLLNPDIPEEGIDSEEKDIDDGDDHILARISVENDIPFELDRTKEYQTKPAHIISKWAEENNIGDEYRRTVYYYYFVLQKNIALPGVLKEIIYKLGFYEVKPEYILENEKYVLQVEEDLREASRLNVPEGPFICYNDKIMMGYSKYKELKKFVIGNENKLRSK